MKVNRIELIPRKNNTTPPYKKKWEIEIYQEDGDRLLTAENTKPNSNGFIYCPDNIPVRDGFNKLKKHIINLHIEEIKNLTDSLNELINLEFSSKNYKITSKNKPTILI